MAYKTFFKKIIFIILAVLISFFLINADKVFAQNPKTPSKSSVGSLLHEAGEAAKYKTTEVEGGVIDTSSIAGGVIKIFLSILGIIFIALMLYGGYLWMTAGGKEEQVTKAIDLIQDAVIGLVIVIAAYAITYFVLFMLAKDYMESDVTGF